MRISKVIKTDEEIRAEMQKDASKSKADIQKAIDERQAHAAEVQREYDKGISAPFRTPGQE